MDKTAFVRNLFRDELPVPSMRLETAVITRRAVMRSPGRIVCGDIDITDPQPIAALCHALVAAGLPDCALQVWDEHRAPVVFLLSFQAIAEGAPPRPLPAEPETIGRTALIRRLVAECDHAGGIRAWARAHGVAHSLVVATIRGPREPSDAIANALGFVCEKTYRRVRKGRRTHPVADGDNPLLPFGGLHGT